MKAFQDTAIEYWNALSIDIMAIVREATSKAWLDYMRCGKSDKCVLDYIDTGELAFLFSTGND